MAINAGMMREALARKMEAPPMAAPEEQGESPAKDAREKAECDKVIQMLKDMESDDPEANAKLEDIIAQLEELFAPETAGEPNAPAPNKNSEQVPQEPV